MSVDWDFPSSACRTAFPSVDTAWPFPQRGLHNPVARSGETTASQTIETIHAPPDLHVVDRPQGLVGGIDGRFKKFLHADDGEFLSVLRRDRCALRNEGSIVRGPRGDTERSLECGGKALDIESLEIAADLEAPD